MQKMKFPEVKGKIIQTIELFVSSEECIIDIGFQDKTSLSFDVEPCVVIMPWRIQTAQALATCSQQIVSPINRLREANFYLLRILPR
jgi:hypothetical protein